MEVSNSLTGPISEIQRRDLEQRLIENFYALLFHREVWQVQGSLHVCLVPVLVKLSACHVCQVWFATAASSRLVTIYLLWLVGLVADQLQTHTVLLYEDCQPPLSVAGLPAK
jgi:hypothetical protein